MPRSRNPLQTQLRDLLRGDLADGASPYHLAKLLGADPCNVKAALKAMPDMYIDRWEWVAEASAYRPVFCAAEIPEDCPKPEVA